MHYTSVLLPQKCKIILQKKKRNGRKCVLINQYVLTQSPSLYVQVSLKKHSRPRVLNVSLCLFFALPSNQIKYSRWRSYSCTYEKKQLWRWEAPRSPHSALQRDLEMFPSRHSFFSTFILIRILFQNDAVNLRCTFPVCLWFLLLLLTGLHVVQSPKHSYSHVSCTFYASWRQD